MKKLYYFLGGLAAVLIVLTGAYVEAQYAPMRRLASGKIVLGNASNIGRPVTPSGDCTMTNAGVITCTDVTVTSDAIGDLLYKSAPTTLARLGIGSGGKILQVADAGAAPSWAAPGESPYVYETFGEGASKGVMNLAIGGTAWSGTAGALNYIYTGGGNKFLEIAMGDNQAVAPLGATEGLDIQGDQAAAEGYEISTGYAGASGRPFVIGTDAAFYFLVGLDIDDVSGCATLVCGFRTMEAFNATYNAYDTYAGLGTEAGAHPLNIRVVEEVNGDGGAVTDTTQTLADGAAYQIKVLVSAAGVTTFQHDATTPGTLAAPTAVSAHSFDDGDLVIPYCNYTQHADLTEGVNITHWEVGYQ